MLNATYSHASKLHIFAYTYEGGGNCLVDGRAPIYTERVYEFFMDLCQSREFEKHKR